MQLIPSERHITTVTICHACCAPARMGHVGRDRGSERLVWHVVNPSACAPLCAALACTRKHNFSLVALRILAPPDTGTPSIRESAFKADCGGIRGDTPSGGAGDDTIHRALTCNSLAKQARDMPPRQRMCSESNRAGSDRYYRSSMPSLETECKSN